MKKGRKEKQSQFKRMNELGQQHCISVVVLLFAVISRGGVCHTGAAGSMRASQPDQQAAKRDQQSAGDYQHAAP